MRVLIFSESFKLENVSILSLIRDTTSYIPALRVKKQQQPTYLRAFHTDLPWRTDKGDYCGYHNIVES